MEKHLLLGIVPHPKVAQQGVGYVIIYSPGPSEYPAHRPAIGLYEPMHRGNGGSTDAATWIARNAETWSPTRKGWFERLCQEANCGWIMPILHRLAAGESVPVEEIKDTYASHNSGREILEGSLDQFFVLAQKDWPVLR